MKTPPLPYCTQRAHGAEVCTDAPTWIELQDSAHTLIKLRFRSEAAAAEFCEVFAESKGTLPYIPVRIAFRPGSDIVTSYTAGIGPVFEGETYLPMA